MCPCVRVCVCMCVCVYLCLTLCNPVDYIPPGSSVHGIFQVRILEWAAISHSSRNIPDPGIKPASAALQVDSVPTESLGTSQAWQGF